MRIAHLVATTVLVGAVTAHAAGPEGTDQALASLVGHSVTLAVRYLGMPNGQTLLQGEKAYQWTAAELMAEAAAPPAGSAMMGAMPPEAGAAAMAPGGPTEARCSLRLFATPGDIVTRFEYDGSEPACGGFSTRLKTLIRP